MKQKKRLLLLMYTLCLGAILYYPADVICSIEFPAEPPVEFRFKVTVYDPYDPFRGRYVQLVVKEDSVMMPDLPQSHYFTVRTAWAVLGKDAEGFACITRFEFDRKKLGDDACAIRVKWPGGAQNKNAVEYPFSRYYVNEQKAPELENELRDGSYMVLTVQVFAKTRRYAVKSLDPVK